MPELSTEELSRQVAQLYSEKESERKKRHELNNNLSKAILSMSADIMRHDEGMQGLEHIGQIVVALDHIVRGVDGKNGLRGNVKELSQTIEGIGDKFNALDQKMIAKLNNLEVKLAGLAAAFSIVGSFVGTLVINWIK